MSVIVRPITKDGLVGFDEFDQLVCVSQTPHGTSSVFVSDVRDKTCVLCGRGWELNGPSFSDQQAIRVMNKHAHQSCLVRHEAYEEFWTVYRSMVDARIRFEGPKEIDNRYWGKISPYSNKPWYELTLLDYPVKFTIGARKRVWSIGVGRIDGGILPNMALEAAFKDENVTKDFCPTSMLVHAWGDADLKKYVKMIAEVCGYNKPVSGQASLEKAGAR